MRARSSRAGVRERGGEQAVLGLERLDVGLQARARVGERDELGEMRREALGVELLHLAPRAQAALRARASRSPTARIAIASPCETQVSISSGPSAEPPT